MYPFFDIHPVTFTSGKYPRDNIVFKMKTPRSSDPESLVVQRVAGLESAQEGLQAEKLVSTGRIAELELALEERSLNDHANQQVGLYFGCCMREVHV